MQDAILEQKSISTAQQNIEAFIKTHDVKYVSENAIFKIMGTGEETKGREAIGGLLHYFYHVAFEAKAEIKNLLITENKAFFEADFTGKHIGEFAGMPPTNKEVHVPLCVSYDIEDGLIKYARIYMLADVMMQQLKG